METATVPAAKRDMKKKLTAEEWWNDIVEYERTHEIAFASPRALLEARMIAEMDKARRPHRRAQRNGAARPLLVATKPELREYKAVYVQSDSEIGLFSDEVVVNCAP